MVDLAADKQDEKIEDLFQDTGHEFKFEDDDPSSQDPQGLNNALLMVKPASQARNKIFLSLSLLVFLCLTLFLTMRYRTKVQAQKPTLSLASPLAPQIDKVATNAPPPF